jgi:hypothetical protein
MFTNLLPDDELYRVYINPYAERHFIKRFRKDYKGKIWLVTLESIKDDLRRVRALENTQQVDELRYKENLWLFKYDFAIAKSGKSPKGSGNRCVAILDSKKYRIEILFLYGKNDLPKNQPETVFIEQTLKDKFPEIWSDLNIYLGAKNSN